MKCESVVNEPRKKPIKPDLAVSSQLKLLWQRITGTRSRLKTMVTHNWVLDLPITIC